MDWLIEVTFDSGCFTSLAIVVIGGLCDSTEASRAAELTRATGSVFCTLLTIWGVGRLFGTSSFAPGADDAEQSWRLDSTVCGKGVLLDASG